MPTYHLKPFLFLNVFLSTCLCFSSCVKSQATNQQFTLLALLYLSNSCDTNYSPPQGSARFYFTRTDTDTGEFSTQKTAYINTLHGLELMTYRERPSVLISGGDMLFRKSALESERLARGFATSNSARYWTSNTVPYEIDPSLPNHCRIQQAVNHFHAYTNITLVARSNESNYLYFTHDDRGVCSSYVGMIGGAQDVTLSPGCRSGEVIHEVGHALGLYHEQQRSDRDSYVTVDLSHVETEYQGNFTKYSSGVSNLGTYDYNSIMHYSSYAFSKDGQPTITLTDDSTFRSNRTGLSSGDVQGLNQLYP